MTVTEAHPIIAEEQTPPGPPPPVAMMNMITGAVWINQAIYIAATLGLADRVGAGPRSVADLAAATGTHAPSLYRVLRALASAGIFTETAEGVFGLTPLAATLQTGQPGSLHGMAVVWGAPWHWHAWGGFLNSVQTGGSGIEHVYGMPLFEFFSRNPEYAAAFDEAMTAFSGQEAAAVAAAYDFSGIDTLVDVGGGQGLLLATILQANRALRGTVLERPWVVDGARALLQTLGVADRATVEAGDFFTAVPYGDAYILKNIVHDFDDETAAAILRSCRRANPQARVLLVQEVIPPGNTPSVGKLLDLQMLLIGGRERTEAGYRALYAAAGYELTRIVPTAAPLHVIEGRPA